MAALRQRAAISRSPTDKPSETALKGMHRPCPDCGVDRLPENTHSVKGRMRSFCNDCEKRNNTAVRQILKKTPRPEVGTPCEICGRCTEQLVCDHEHSSGKHRGWLCRTCNVSLGMLGDSSVGLKRALAYLERHHGRSSGGGSQSTSISSVPATWGTEWSKAIRRGKGSANSSDAEAGSDLCG